MIAKDIHRCLSRLKHVRADRRTLDMLGNFGAETFIAADKDIRKRFVEQLATSVSVGFADRTTRDDLLEEERQLIATLRMEGTSVTVVYGEDMLLLHHNILLALDKLYAILSPLQQRLQAILDQAERVAEWIGDGVKLHSIVFNPIDVHSDYQKLLSEPLLVSFEVLQPSLAPGVVAFTISIADDLMAEAKEIRPSQIRRAAAKRRRRERDDNRFEADALTLAVLRAADVEGRELVRSDLGDLERYTLSLPDMKLENINFIWNDGRQDVYFDFEEGRYAPGELLFWQQFPETMLVGVVGKPVNEIIAGELFSQINAVITEASPFGSGTLFSFDPVPVWVEDW